MDSLVFSSIRKKSSPISTKGHDPLKTLLDIIGLETVLFGSNALGVLTTVFLFLCRILRFKWRKVYSMFLLLLAFAGFLAHNVLVFQAIISGDLDENEFFEKPQRYTLPSPILCFRTKRRGMKTNVLQATTWTI